MRIQIVTYLLFALAFGLIVYAVNLLGANQNGPAATVMIAGAILLILSFLGGIVWQTLAMMRQHEVGFLKASLIIVVGVVVIVGALTYFPALSLGPIAEHLTL